jgi:L-ascorbate metabolism protein UlaG (beta-lactamase superfamily)
MRPEDLLEKDEIETSEGTLSIYFIGHASLLFIFQDKTIYVDPYSKMADFSKLPKANLILITHEHGDHLDLTALSQIRAEGSKLIYAKSCTEQIEGGIVMNNGDVKSLMGVKIEAVPAYNTVHKRDNGEPFHPRGVGNGYILTFGNKRLYVAGDTENIQEMKSLERIDIAFLPMNTPYTMTPEMAADSAKNVRPSILYPYHYGDTDTTRLIELLRDNGDIDIRIRNMA